MDKFSYSNYRQIEFHIVNQLGDLRRYAHNLGEAELETKADKAIRRIQNHSFSLAVVGEFKRGKSTFINALLGKEILPADVLPTSATLNRVAYGLEPAVEIAMKNGERIQVEVEQLKNYVTKLTPEAQETAASVQEAIVYYPIPFCKNNVNIIDTPGLNDEAAMTEVTLSVLPRIDAAIFVIMPTAPFAGSEGAFLNRLLEHEIGKVIFVVTAIDRIRRRNERKRVLENIEQRIQQAVAEYAAEQFGENSQAYQTFVQRLGKPRVYGLSGYDALVAKETKDETLLADSGFLDFEQSLESFLLEERGAITLRVAVENVINISAALLAALEERKISLIAQQQQLDESVQTTQASLQGFREQNESEIGQITNTKTAVLNETRTHLETMEQALLLEASKIIDAAPITAAELNKASFGAVTNYVQQGSRQLGKWWDRVPKNFRDQIKQSTAGLSNNIRDATQSPILEQMSDEIGTKVQEMNQQWQQAAFEIVDNALAAEKDRLKSVAATLELGLTETQSTFEQDTAIIADTPPNQQLTEKDLIASPIESVSSNLRLSTLNSAASSSFLSAREMLSDSLDNLRNRFSGQGNEGKELSHDRVTAFKSNHKQVIEKEIQRWLADLDQVNAMVMMIDQSFQRLEQTAIVDLNQSLSQMELTIDSLRQSKQRQLILAEQDLANFQTIAGELNQMKIKMQQQLQDLFAILNKN